MKVDRLVSIIMILLDKERIGARELADQFEVSLRTIYRDIDAINMAGIPVRSISGVGGGFEIMHQYKVDKKVFSTSDLSNILMGLSGLSNVVHGEELVNAFAKVKSFIPAERAKDIELRANQIHIDFSPWFENKNMQTYLEKIKEAMQESRRLIFSYIAHHGNQTMRTVEPYQLVLKNSQWYLQAYCMDRMDFRLFKLSRMLDLEMLADTFEQQVFQKPHLEFVDSLETMKIEIIIRIHQSIMDMVLDYCDYEHFTPDGENYFIVRFPFIEKDYYYNILLGFGDKCECIEPLYVRKELKVRIQNMLSLYVQR